MKFYLNSAGEVALELEDTRLVKLGVLFSVPDEKEWEQMQRVMSRAFDAGKRERSREIAKLIL